MSKFHFCNGRINGLILTLIDSLSSRLYSDLLAFELSWPKRVWTYLILPGYRFLSYPQFPIDQVLQSHTFLRHSSWNPPTTRELNVMLGGQARWWCWWRSICRCTCSTHKFKQTNKLNHLSHPYRLQVNIITSCPPGKGMQCVHNLHIFFLPTAKAESGMSHSVCEASIAIGNTLQQWMFSKQAENCAPEEGKILP